jgi:hypothetical protein
LTFGIRLFDRSRRCGDNETLMRKWLKRTRRPIVWALTLAFAVVLSADCALGKELTEAQKACCAAMNHDCGQMAKEQGCCAIEGQKVDQFTTAKQVSLTPPFVIAVRLAAVPDLPLFSQAWHRPRPDRVPLRLPGVPTYLLVSTFLI